MNSIIISGSSNYNGDTEKLSVSVASLTNSSIIRLKDYNISQYDYEHNNENDDFFPLIKKVLSETNTIIFITPVYWYSMSGYLKVFFDRITDLITINKALGRQLRGVSIAVITTSNGDNLGNNFWFPFKKSSNYLGMKYLGNSHTINAKSNQSLINLIKKINE